MKYLLIYDIFEGLFWNTKVKEYDTLEKVQIVLNNHPRVKNVRIFEISKEIKIKITIEEVE